MFVPSKTEYHFSGGSLKSDPLFHYLKRKPPEMGGFKAACPTDGSSVPQGARIQRVLLLQATEGLYLYASSSAFSCSVCIYAKVVEDDDHRICGRGAGAQGSKVSVHLCLPVSTAFHHRAPSFSDGFVLQKHVCCSEPILCDTGGYDSSGFVLPRPVRKAAQRFSAFSST